MYNQRIQDAWDEKCRLYAEGRKLYVEGDKLIDEGRKLYAEGKKLYDEGRKLRVESAKLYAEGNIQFFNVIISVFGKECEVKWNGNNPVIEGWEYKEGGKGPENCNGKVVEIEDKNYKLVEEK